MWLEERKARAEARLEDIGFIECAPRYPAEERLGNEIGDSCNEAIDDPVDDVHLAVFVRTGPEYMGHPSTRHRLLGALVNKHTMVWTGPVSEALEADFRDHFWRSPQVAGAMLCCDTEENRWEFYQSLAAAMASQMQVSDLRQLPSWELMTYLGPPGQAQRYQEWRAFMLDHHFLQEGQGFMVDLDHHPQTKGCTGGREFPTQLCHGTVAALTRDSFYLATPLERFCALGFHALPAACTRWPECDLMRIFREVGLG